MPVLGLTMEEGTVAEWLKHEGETVRKDEPLLTVEMDKGTVEVPSPASGVLRRIVVQPGTTVPVRTLIAEIGEPGEAPATESPSSAGGPGDLPLIEATPRELERVSVAPREQLEHVSVARREAEGVSLPSRVFASPRARMRARTMGVDIGRLSGSGPHGRIVESDVLAAAPAETRVAATPLARRLAQE